MNKRGVKFGIVLFLLAIIILLVSTIFAETPAKEKARLEQELAKLETQLAQVDNGTWVNYFNLMSDKDKLLVSPNPRIFSKILEKQKSHSSNFSIKSLVLNTLTVSCFFNDSSPDQTGQFNLRDKAKYGISFECGHIFFAFDNLSENFSNGTDTILNLIISTNTSKSLSENPDLVFISCEFLSSSRNSKEGANNLISSENNISNFLVCLPLPLAIIAENNSFESITNSIYNHSNSFLSSLNILLFTLSANSLASPSFNLLFAINDSNMALCNAFDLKSCNSNALAINASLTTSSQSMFGFSSISNFNSFGISSFNSAISSSPRENNERDYLNVAENE